MDAENVSGLLHPLVDLVLGKFAYPQPEAQVIAHVHVRIECVILKDHGNVPVLGRHIVDESVVDVNLAGGHVLKTGDHPKRRGLAASGRSHQHRELPVLDFDVQVIDCHHRLELLRHILQNDTGHVTPPISIF